MAKLKLELCVAEVVAPVQIPNLRKVWCYPVQFATPPCPRLPQIEYLVERDQTLLRFNGDAVSINTGHLQKLVSWFPMFFMNKTPCSVRRYTLIGVNNSHFRNTYTDTIALMIRSLSSFCHEFGAY